MDVIYSRKRIKMPKMDDKHKNRLQKAVRIAIILIIAIFTCTYTIQSIEPILNTICKSEAKAIATKISNVRATEVMSNYSYSDTFLSILEGLILITL